MQSWSTHLLHLLGCLLALGDGRGGLRHRQHLRFGGGALPWCDLATSCKLLRATSRKQRMSEVRIILISEPKPLSWKSKSQLTFSILFAFHVRSKLAPTSMPFRKGNSACETATQTPKGKVWHQNKPHGMKVISASHIQQFQNWEDTPDRRLSHFDQGCFHLLHLMFCLLCKDLVGGSEGCVCMLYFDAWSFSWVDAGYRKSWDSKWLVRFLEYQRCLFFLEAWLQSKGLLVRASADAFSLWVLEACLASTSIQSQSLLTRLSTSCNYRITSSPPLRPACYHWYYELQCLASHLVHSCWSLFYLCH